MSKAPAARQRRRSIIGVAITLVAAAVLYSCFRPAAPPALVLEHVVRGDVERVVEATGTLKPSRLVSVGAQVSGRIESLHVEVGDKVEAGDLIAEIDSRPQRNALQSAQAAQRGARANRSALAADLHQYMLTLERQEKLLVSQLTSRSDYDSAKANVDATRERIKALDAEIVQRETDVDIAQTNLGYTRVTAPADGTVLTVLARQGQTVNAVQSAPTIVMLGNQDVMTVYAEISEADVVNTAPGQEVFFTVLGEPDRRYTSTLREIAPAPESITNEDAPGVTAQMAGGGGRTAMYYNGLFDVENDKARLKSYMTAQVRIVLGRATNVLTIPSAALGARASDGRYTVRVPGADGHPTPRQITIGLDDQVRVEVKSGLEEGEQVVLREAPANMSSSADQTRAVDTAAGSK